MRQRKMIKLNQFIKQTALYTAEQTSNNDALSPHITRGMGMDSVVHAQMDQTCLDSMVADYYWSLYNTQSKDRVDLDCDHATTHCDSIIYIGPIHECKDQALQITSHT
eukprot:172341_1